MIKVTRSGGSSRICNKAPARAVRNEPLKRGVPPPSTVDRLLTVANQGSSLSRRATAATLRRSHALPAAERWPLRAGLRLSRHGAGSLQGLLRALVISERASLVIQQYCSSLGRFQIEASQLCTHPIVSDYGQVIEIRKPRRSSPIAVNGKVAPPRRRPNHKTRSREYVTPTEMETLLEAAGSGRYGHRDRALLLVMYRHGLRVSEAISLR
jgi:hypothetical protein